ncbi:unnamed protein product [Clonostachys rosea f. rosea IK726]|uniref:Uncharacterized protein n=1 Tax=Clonostachys rosea f. rosea IK726 TaxID=1349383 RepID=A0ACA9TPK9_BIOOC|nr:unnamed protein product [Clonostachys rosea f. rosea IK726]
MESNDKHQRTIPSMEKYPSSGLSVIVVGGGIAGLGFAIEACRKSHNVRVLERRPQFVELGDLMVLQSSALHTPKLWPGFLEMLASCQYNSPNYFKKFDGTFIGAHHPGSKDAPSTYVNRAKFHGILEEYARQQCIDIEYSANVVEYFETNDAAGVKFDDGHSRIADVIVAADGVGTKSWGLLHGSKAEPINSGFAVTRVTFPAGPALENLVIVKEFEGFSHRVSLHVGPDSHMVVGKTDIEICWLLNHPDTDGAVEDWSYKASSDIALLHVEGWHPFFKELINATPNHEVTNWKLMWRNAPPTWVSPMGRVVQIGDAAHTFLPTSASGATMALEDGYSLAACLEKGGRERVALATRVHNNLRYERVSCAQRMGLKNRENFHKTDWDYVREHPEVLTSTIGLWLIHHNPEKYAIENFESCAAHIEEGKTFQNTNAVPGYTWKPWTIEQLLAATDNGEEILDEGDWS